MQFEGNQVNQVIWHLCHVLENLHPKGIFRLQLMLVFVRYPQRTRGLQRCQMMSAWRSSKPWRSF